MAKAPDTVALVGCVVAVWAFWSVHDVLQERVFRVPGYKFGFFQAFVLQASAFILSAVQQAVGSLFTRRPRGGREDQEKLDEADEVESQRMLLRDGEGERGCVRFSTFAWYLLLSVLIAGANGCATAALNYVTMQVKVLFKSSKIVTVMLIGCAFGRFYGVHEYGFMMLVALGLITFFLAGARGALESSLVGVALLVGSVVCDSLVPNVQQRLLQDLKLPKGLVVFHTNWISALLTLIYICVTGELFAAVTFLRRRRRVIQLMLLQAVAGYFGIIAYLETVSRFGSKVTTVVTSCRKLFTILLSSILFAHALSGYHLLGVLSVFAGVILNSFSDRRCARILVIPTLLLMVAVVYSLVASSKGLQTAELQLLHSLLSTYLYDPAASSRPMQVRDYDDE